MPPEPPHWWPAVLPMDGVLSADSLKLSPVGPAGSRSRVIHTRACVPSTLKTDPLASCFLHTSLMSSVNQGSLDTTKAGMLGAPAEVVLLSFATYAALKY